MRPEDSRFESDSGDANILRGPTLRKSRQATGLTSDLRRSCYHPTRGAGISRAARAAKLPSPAPDEADQGVRPLSPTWRGMTMSPIDPQDDPLTGTAGGQEPAEQKKHRASRSCTPMTCIRT